MDIPTKKEEKSSLLNSKFFWWISVILLCVLLVLLVLFILFFHKKDNNQDNNQDNKKVNYTQKPNTYKSDGTSNVAGCGYDFTKGITENAIQKLCDADSNCKGYYYGNTDADSFIMSSITPSTTNTDCHSGDIKFDYFKLKSDNYTKNVDNNNSSKYSCVDKSNKTLNYPGSCRGLADCEDKIRLLCDNSKNCVGYYKNTTSNTFIAATKNQDECDADNYNGSEYDSDDASYQNDYIYFMEKNT